MVIIQPSSLCLGEQVLIDETLIKRRKGQGFKSQHARRQAHHHHEVFTANAIVVGFALGFECPVYLGHAEVWVGPDGGTQDARRNASRAAVEDEAKFIDFAASTLFTGIETRLIE